MFCSNCGAPDLDDKAVVCPKCGVQIRPLVHQSKDDEGSIGWYILGFLIPIVGLVLYLIWKDEKPITAKQLGIGALISVCIGAVLYLVVFSALVLNH